MKDTERPNERGMNMRTTRLIAVLVGLAAIAMVAADASAYYHPGMGTFMSRDPGAGNANRIGAGGPAVGGGFIPRDPTGSNQYADGMNLYQYVRSNPVRHLDPQGLGVETQGNGAKIVSYKGAYNLASGYQSQGDTWYTRVATSSFGSLLISSYAQRMAPKPQAVQGTEMAIRQFLQNGFRVGSMSYGFNPGGNTPNAASNRFIYTCKKGWIDAGHYMISAGAAYAAGEQNSLLAGYGMEVAQQISLWLGIGMNGWAQSAFTAEDLMSDLLGARAGQSMRDATVALNPALQQQVQNWAAGGRPGKGLAWLAFGPHDLAARFRDDLRVAGAVNPARKLPGGKTAMDYLIDMGNWTHDHHTYWFYSRKPPGHYCVCDKNDDPIGGSE